MSDTPEKWSDEQRLMYNRMYRFAISNQDCVLSKNFPRVPDMEWHIVSHNMAYLAAEFVANDRVQFVDPSTGRTVGESPPDVMN